jgi:hypothetical protein
MHLCAIPLPLRDERWGLSTAPFPISIFHFPAKQGAACQREIFQGAETSVEFGGRQAPLALERAQKIPDRAVALARVAFETAGNQVAVGIPR